MNNHCERVAQPPKGLDPAEVESHVHPPPLTIRLPHLLFIYLTCKMSMLADIQRKGDSQRKGTKKGCSLEIQLMEQGTKNSGRPRTGGVLTSYKILVLSF